MLESPAVRSHVHVLFDQIPNRRRHRQGHQFGPPVVEQQSFHRRKTLSHGVVSGSGKVLSSLFSD
jgi:hypothetical protein